MRIFSLAALLLLTVAALGTAPVAQAQLGPYCPTGGAFQSTPLNWGKGTDCLAARADLRANAAADISCPDYGECLNQRQLVITLACRQISSTMFQEDGYFKYKCKICPTCP